MDLVERLRNTPLFRFVDHEGLARVASIAQEHEVPEGTTLCRQADLGATFFLIDRGETIVQRVDDKGFLRPIGTLRDGDSFGVTSLFFAEPRDATIITRTPMRLWTIQRPEFQDLLDRYDRLWEQITLPPGVEARQKMPDFDWLGPAEHVVYFARRHWIALARAIALPTVVVFLILFVITLPLIRGIWTVDLSPLFVLIGGSYLAFLTWHWMDWINDHFVITTQRISHQELLVLLNASRSELPIDRVQNINVIVRFLGNYLGFGTMVIETAAFTGTVVFDDIPKPEEMRQAIWQQNERALATRRATERRLMTETLSNHLGINTDEGLPQEVTPGEGLPNDVLDNQPAQREPDTGWHQALQWLQTLNILPSARLEKDGTVIWRKHTVFLWLRAAVPLLLSVLLVPLTVMAFFGYLPVLVAMSSYWPYLLLVMALVALGWLAFEFVDWGNDLYIVTDERIIDFKQWPFGLHMERREASLGVIQNVRFEIPNMWAWLFNYGSVLVQTAGRGDFTFDHVKDPASVQDEIFHRIEAFRERQRQQESALRRREMAEWFSIYDELEQKKREPEGAQEIQDEDQEPTGPENQASAWPRSESDTGEPRSSL